MHGKYALLNHIGIQGNSTTVHPKEIVRGMVIRVVEFSSGGGFTGLDAASTVLRL